VFTKVYCIAILHNLRHHHTRTRMKWFHRNLQEEASVLSPK